MLSHGFGVDGRHHDGRPGRARGTDGAEQICPIVAVIPHGGWSRAATAPYPRQGAPLTHPGFIGEPDLERSVERRRCQRRADEKREACFECLLCRCIFLRMARAHGKAPKPELTHDLADRALMKADGEFLLDPRSQINTAPADDAVSLQVRTVLDPSDQLGFLLRSETGRGTVAVGSVGQSSNALIIVAMNPITQRLPVHAAALSRVLPRTPFKHKRELASLSVVEIRSELRCWP